MKTTIINEISAFLFGRKYYANVINVRGTQVIEICSKIFYTKKEAEQHRMQINQTASFQFVETISFRSRSKAFLLRLSNLNTHLQN